MPEQWALITGASSGIGAAIAERLAVLNYNLLLVGRDESALREQATLIQKNHSVTIKILSADLSTPKGIEHVLQTLRTDKIVVEVLVNNAGFGVHGFFSETHESDELRMIDLQLKALTSLTKAVLPEMCRRGSGRILNVSSVYAFSPVPQQAVYAACKSYLLSFSRSLALELHSSGVTVSVLCPGITMTGFRTRAGMKEKKSFFSMSADAVAAIAIRGMMRGKAVIVPGWHNSLYAAASRWLPAGLLGGFTRWFNRRRGIAGKK